MEMDHQTYLFHQTPKECAKDLIAHCPLAIGDKVIEPFSGEGAFYDNFPDFVEKDWAEIRRGKCYTDIEGDFDWVITNPPFRLETGTKRINSFWYLLDYYTTRAKKGIAFLGNDSCFCTLTPKRQKILEERGWGLTKIVVSSIKKWRGRYFFFILEKKPGFMTYLLKNY